MSEVAQMGTWPGEWGEHLFSYKKSGRGFPLWSGPPFFTWQLKNVGEEKKRTPSAEMHASKPLGLVQL